jgi:cell pole-organizing protein PopZ
MNKPATKEPSMDEILSSIRQIIADDDAAAAAKAPVAPASAAGMNTTAGAPLRPSIPPLAPRPAAPAAAPSGRDDDRPLALKPSQIVANAPKPEAAKPEAGQGEAGKSALGLGSDRPKSFAELIDAPEGEAPADFDVPAELIDPDDITFVGEDPQQRAPAKPVEPAPPAEEARMAQTVAFKPQPRDESKPEPSTLPDRTLSSDIAEELLEPATKAAVKGTFGRLNGLSSVAPGITIEEMIRDLMRPMLKEWLDENLPAVVERMVEKEIARISRGTD